MIPRMPSGGCVLIDFALNILVKIHKNTLANRPNLHEEKNDGTRKNRGNQASD